MGRAVVRYELLSGTVRWGEVPAAAIYPSRRRSPPACHGRLPWAAAPHEAGVHGRGTRPPPPPPSRRDLCVQVGGDGGPADPPPPSTDSCRRGACKAWHPSDRGLPLPSPQSPAPGATVVGGWEAGRTRLPYGPVLVVVVVGDGWPGGGGRGGRWSRRDEATPTWCTWVEPRQLGRWERRTQTRPPGDGRTWTVSHGGGRHTADPPASRGRTRSASRRGHAPQAATNEEGAACSRSCGQRDPRPRRGTAPVTGRGVSELVEGGRETAHPHEPG